MKPLLILAPSPARWQVVEHLLGHQGEAWVDDMRRRLVEGLANCQDAVAVIPEGAGAVAGACIRRRGDIGVLGHVFTAPAQRKQGHARSLLQTLLSWFDMTGGRWLYLTSPRDAATYLFENFGFRALHHSSEPDGQVTMMRTPANASESPFGSMTGRVRIREVTRADWVLIVVLLHHFVGPDPRVGLAQSALSAEGTALDLIRQQEGGSCRLLAACHQDRVVGLGSVAVNREGGRTYAMLLPHDHPPEGLREAVLEFASKQGYAQVDFPMEALAVTPAPGTPVDDQPSPRSTD